MKDNEKLMHIRFILKSGAEFTMKCESFTLSRNGLNQITSWKAKGIVENKPLEIDFSQVAAIVRVYSNEVEVDE